MDLVAKIKTAMRINHNKLDDSISSDIQAGALDLYRSGVQPYVLDQEGNITIVEEQKVIVNDELIHKALELFVKWQYDFAEKGEQFNKAYEKMRDSLALCDDYVIKKNVQ